MWVFFSWRFNTEYKLLDGGQIMPTALYLTLLYYKMNDAFDGNNLTC
jgi:hypothetical protein